MFTPLKLRAVHYNPSCGGCACVAEENRKAKRVFVQQNIAKKRLAAIYTLR